jgi:hypothetical protein
MPTNLSDPAFEPTDEQLVALSERAFEDLRKKHLELDAKLRARILAARKQRKSR